MYSRGVGELENIPWELLCLSLSHITDIDELNQIRRVSPILAKLVSSCTRKITSNRNISLTDVITFPSVKVIEPIIELEGTNALEMLFLKLPNLTQFSVVLQSALTRTVIAKTFELLNTRTNWNSFSIRDNFTSYIFYHETTLKIGHSTIDDSNATIPTLTGRPEGREMSGRPEERGRSGEKRSGYFDTVIIDVDIDLNIEQPDPIIAAVTKVPITTLKFRQHNEPSIMMAYMSNLSSHKSVHNIYCLNCYGGSDIGFQILNALDWIRDDYPNIYIEPPYTNIRVFDIPMAASTAFEFLDYFPNVITIKILSMNTVIQELKRSFARRPSLIVLYTRLINESELERNNLPSNLDRLKLKYPQINFIIVN